MLLINDFEKKYGETLILRIDALRLERGIYWIRGENGSGKSSFFRSLAGIIPCRGDIRFADGISLHANPVQYRLRVNFSEAEPVYPGFLCARDIIHFVASAKRAPVHRQKDLVSSFGVDQFLTRQCSTFSSGMLKRLSLCLAFLGSPHVIVLDEPLITLDSSIRNTLFSQINQSLERDNTIFLISSHESLATHELHLNQILSVRDKKLIA